MEHVTLTPHMSGDTEDYLDDLGKLFVDNLKRFWHDGPMQNIVDKTLVSSQYPDSQLTLQRTRHAGDDAHH